MFVSVDGAKHYILIHEYFRNEGQSKAQQAEFFSGSAHAWSIGLSAGYGYELLCNLYVGLKAFGLYNTAEIVKKENEPDKLIKFTPNGAESVFNVSAYAMSTKPRFSFGGSILLGYKVIPNVLVYLSFGYEWTKITFNQAFIGKNQKNVVGSEIMGFSHGSTVAQSIPLPDSEEITIDTTLFDKGELQTNLRSLLPGIGLRYYFTKCIYIGAEASLSLGAVRALDATYFIQSGKYYIKGNLPPELPIKSLDDLKSSAYAKPFGFRVGVSLGLTF
ncbi:MAG: hypothetical protein LBJ89_00690 [Holosporales bacterium]|jgi:hypothetical protein|nr:hypothetical protein [Holosporales bacterium]